MKLFHRGRARWFVRLLPLLFATLLTGPALGQGYGGPLNVQGLNARNNPSAASRAFGGVTFGTGSDIGLMFLNPASLHELSGLQISVAGGRRYQDLEQVQQYAPVRYYPNLSVLLDGMTGSIPNIDPDLIGFTPRDSVQRPFDSIGPDWSRSRSSSRPLHALVAAPFRLGGVRVVAGLGAVQYANLDHFYQNNNVLTPGVLSTRPLPTLRPTDDNPVEVDWLQSSRSRDGSLYGYGGALSGFIDGIDLALGVSGLLLRGSTDDREQTYQRGRLTFLANEFRADSVVGHNTRTGTSDFSGAEFAFSAMLVGRYATIGGVVRPPTTFTREYEVAVQGDSLGAPFSASLQGEDQFKMPWRGSVGLLVQPMEKLRIGLEYEFRPYADAVLTTAGDTESNPWQSSSLFRVGAQYELASWLVLRGGLRGESEVFVPEGSALSEPPTFRVYSAGFGLNHSGFSWNVAYEYANMKYQDVWSAALSRNDDVQHVITTSLSWTLPVAP